jgi:tetratricopeptide (TPR) repeat protein
MIKNILFSTLAFLICLGVNAQDSTIVDSAKTNKLSVGAHSEFSASRQIKNVTKIEGDSAYIRNDYVAAIQIYEALLKKGDSAEILYNLGNSYYKAGDIAKAILNYERALLLQPDNSDIRANLEIARSKTIDKVVPVPDIFFISWIKSLINSLSINVWARVGITCFILLLISIYIYFFSKYIKWRKISFIFGAVFFVSTILANIFAFYQRETLLERNQAIVLAPSITVRSTPSEDGTSLFILHEGHKVEIKDNTMREWKEIKLEDGKVGWVPISSIEVI